LFHVDARTDVSKLAAFRNFAKVPKIEHELRLKKLVPLSKRPHSYKTIQLMLYNEITAVCTEIHIKHMITLYGQNIELPNIKSNGTYSYHWAVEVHFTRLVSISLDCLTLHYGTERFSRNVGNYQSTMRNISEERRFIFGLQYFSA